MAVKLEEKVVVGISARALFDLTKENEIFERDGVESYRLYQIEHENEILKQGPGFSLIRALLDLNHLCRKELVEVIIMSRNSPDTSLRIFNSIKHYHLPITRSVLVSGAPLAPYLKAFQTDLFLSACEEDVQAAVDEGIAGGIICSGRQETEKGGSTVKREKQTINIAFDADAVIFSDESECIYQQSGLEAFKENESRNARNPLKEGPFAGFLRTLSRLQKEVGREVLPIRTALVTARCAPAHERVLRTLREWDVRIDEAFFLGGIGKKEVLRAFQADIFFDDQSVHTTQASEVVLAARVPAVRKEAV